MNKLSCIGLCVLLAVSCSKAWAETVVPMQGQTSHQTQLDIDDCHDVALKQSTAPPAAGGQTTVAEQPGRQHDEFYKGGDDSAKQAYTHCLQGKGYQVNP